MTVAIFDRSSGGNAIQLIELKLLSKSGLRNIKEQQTNRLYAIDSLQ